MSLSSDIRNALKSVGLSIPDATETMRHIFESGTAIKSSSVDLAGEAASESGAVEKSRVIVDAADFPSLDSDSLVSLGEHQHIVTSLRNDPVGVSMTVGLSERLAKYFAHYTGTRRARAISFPLELLAVNNGRATDYADGYAPVEVQSYTLVIPREAWPESAAPQIGDEARLDSVLLRISRVTEKNTSFILAARSR